jgi:hypothetical protein
VTGHDPIRGSQNPLLYLRETGEWLGEEVRRDVPKIEQLAPLVRAVDG